MMMMSHGTEASLISRYDRQLRLWGNHGQHELERATVFVLGASVACCEALKALILPGIKSFALFDNRPLTNLDVDSNYFVENLETYSCQDQCLTKAQAVMHSLLALNSSVSGRVIRDFAELLDSVLSECSLLVISYDLLIADERLEDMFEMLYEHDIPVYVIYSRGSIGITWPCFRYLTTFELHKDHEPFDLRLTDDAMFPELSEFSEQIFNRYENDAIADIPWPLLLWKCKRSGNEDMSSALQTLVDWKKTKSNTTKAELENFDDAISNCKKTLRAQTHKPSSRLKDTLKLVRELDFTARSDRSQVRKHLTMIAERNMKFMCLIEALHIYLGENSNTMPITGKLPDINTPSTIFFEFRRMYNNKASADLSKLKQILASQATTASYSDEIETLQRFCKHANDARIIAGRSWRQWKGIDDSSAEGDQGDSIIMAILVAVENFKRKWHRQPLITKRNPNDTAFLYSDIRNQKLMAFRMHAGPFPTETEQELVNGIVTAEADGHHFSSSCCTTEQSETQTSASFDDSTMTLISSATEAPLLGNGPEEMPVVSGWIGSALGHEITKVLTGQFEPSNRCLYFDGTRCSTN